MSALVTPKRTLLPHRHALMHTPKLMIVATARCKSMAKAQAKRRLAAILAVDVAGYSTDMTFCGANVCF
jgi:hypothetical protein